MKKRLDKSGISCYNGNRDYRQGLQSKADITMKRTLLGLALAVVLLFSEGGGLAQAGHAGNGICLLPVDVVDILTEKGYTMSKWVVLRKEKADHFAKATKYPRSYESFWLNRSTSHSRTYVGIMLNGCIIDDANFPTKVLENTLKNYKAD